MAAWSSRSHQRWTAPLPPAEALPANSWDGGGLHLPDLVEGVLLLEATAA